MSSAIFPTLAPPVRAALFAALFPVPDEALDPTEWTPPIARRIATRRLSVHALWVAREHAIDMPGESRDLLEAAAEQETLMVLRLHTIGAELQAVLRDHGIDSLGIKGVAVADLHGDELPRYFGDIDLLVAPADFERAIDAYESVGFRPAESVSPWSRRFGGAANLTRGSGREVDVQRAIRPWCWGRHLDFGQLLARSRVVAETRVLGTADALIATALAQIADTRTNTWKLIPWRDLVVLSRAADAALVASIAHDAGLSQLVARAFAALPADSQRFDLDRLLYAARPMSLPMRVRFASFAQDGWNENWFVRIIREVPAARIPLAVGALTVLPPADMTTRQWWRHCASVFERRRDTRRGRSLERRETDHSVGPRSA